jgi:hypothetical protein
MWKCVPNERRFRLRGLGLLRLSNMLFLGVLTGNEEEEFVPVDQIKQLCDEIWWNYFTG